MTTFSVDDDLAGTDEAETTEEEVETLSTLTEALVAAAEELELEPEFLLEMPNCVLPG